MTPTKITVELDRGTFDVDQRGHTVYHTEARIDAAPECYGRGDSVSEAIGDLVSKHPERFGVVIDIK